MKKIIKINIGGTIFHLDDDAHQLLQNYLISVNQKFVSDNERNEIISDIEHRIAEILQSKLSKQKEVITKEDIEELIGIMGKPEDFDDETSDSEVNNDKQADSKKKLYRDPDNKILGGVCSGIANYFNIDPLIVRILFFVMVWAYGASAIVYFVLWIVLPLATTTAEKLNMKGKKFNISDIEKNARKEYEGEKNNPVGEIVKSFFNALGYMFRFLFRFIAIIIGLVLVLSGIGFLLGFTGTLFIGRPLMPWNNLIINDHLVLVDVFNLLMDPNVIWLFSICLILVVFIPIIAITYGGFKLLLGLRPNDKVIAKVGVFTWIISLITLIAIVGIQVQDISYSAVDNEIVTIEKPKNKILYLKSKLNKSAKVSTFYIFDNEYNVVLDKNNNEKLYDYPRINIERGYSDNVEIKIDKIGRGSNRSEAFNNANDIKYHVTQKGNEIIFDAVYSLSDKKEWRFPKVYVDIKIPKGYIIYIDKSLEDQLREIYFEEYRFRYKALNKYWEMTEDGLDEYTKEIP